MPPSPEIICPFCGQAFSPEIDPTEPDQEWIIDCEVCCRPLQVHLHLQGEEILGLDVRPG